MFAFCQQSNMQKSLCSNKVNFLQIDATETLINVDIHKSELMSGPWIYFPVTWASAT